MRICAIAGGVGSARFLAGLARVVETGDITGVVNTGDDARIAGLHISPDVDSVLYHLANVTDWERGWGLDGETFVAHERYKELASRVNVDVDLHDWFALGDRDLATHMLRTRLLDAGRSLSDATDAIRVAMGVASRVLPMSDDRVATMLMTDDGERLDFQTYFVRRHHAPVISAVAYDGAAEAHPAPGVIDAIEAAGVVVIPPSNPVLSVGPVLAVPGIREALSSAKVVAVSPIVGGRALKGPADRVLASLGHEATAAGVAKFYGALVDTFVIDDADRAHAGSIQGDVLVCDTIMSGPDAAARLCKEILARVA